MCKQSRCRAHMCACLPTSREGTFRDNLDPFHNRSDDEIQKAMQKASLDPDLIFEHVDKGGSNLSAGQRQLVCFARAALYKTPIVVLDEPTSSCDMVSGVCVRTLVHHSVSFSVCFVSFFCFFRFLPEGTA